MNTNKRSFLTSVGLFLLALPLQFLVWNYLKAGPFLVFYPLVVISSLYAEGITVVILSSLAAQIFFFNHHPEFSPIRMNLFYQVFFILNGLIIALISKRFRKQKLSAESHHRNISVLNKLGQSLVSELEVKTLVQRVVDAGVVLSEAQFGVFFYSFINDEGTSTVLYTLGGAVEAPPADFPLPRNTCGLQRTLNGEGTLRSGDISKDPRFGQNAPYFGIPENHFPMKSFLGVPVVSRSGKVIGSLLFGHREKDVFTEDHQELIEGLAAQAAVAMDNASLYQNAQVAVKSRDEFLSIASHELKTPLTALVLQNDLRLKQLELEPAGYFDAEKVSKIFADDRRQVDRLVRLVDDMLDISRLVTGKLSIRKKESPVGQMFRDVLHNQTEAFKARNVELTSDVDQSLVARVDLLRIEQVLVNLLSNALKYGRNKPVHVRLFLSGENLVFEVTDQGIGIPKESLERIFKRFERVVSEVEITGLGMGLYICKQIAELHGGEIKVQSEPGKGSTFTVRIPF